MMCQGKIPFPTYADAEKINKRRSYRSGNKRTTRIRPRAIYKCPICHQWHLGHSDSIKH